MSKPRVKILNWAIAQGNNSFWLSGKVINHYTIGTRYAETSELIKIDFVKKEAETLNTIYELL
jgi:hypothetical protein